MKSLLRCFAITHKEFLQISRDRISIVMIFGIPMMQLLLFGYAINTDVRNISAAYIDEADTHLSRQLVADLSGSQVIKMQQRTASIQEMNELLDAGSISIGIVIPDDFDRRIIERDRQAVQLLVDGTDPIILGVAQQLTAIPIGFDSQGSRPATSLIEVRNYYNPERRSAVNIVPGLVGVILTMTMAMFTAVAIVRERELGNLELLINTPVKKAELMIGKITPYTLIGLFQLVVILGLGNILFDIPIHGSRIDVLLASLVFIGTNLALGLLFSTIARTQFQSFQMTFVFFLPSILLSGFMFPYDGMPEIVQSMAEILPLTHFNRLIRGIVLRGADLMSMRYDFVVLVISMFVVMSLAILRFKKQLD